MDSTLEVRRSAFDVSHSDFLLIQWPVHEVVEAIHAAFAGEGDEFDLAGVAGFKAHGGAGGDVQAEAAGGGAGEVEGGIDLEKMKVAADLDGAVALIGNLQGNGVEADIGGKIRRAGRVDDFAGDHAGQSLTGLWTVTSLVPSGKVASAWMSWIISATPSMTSLFLTMVVP